MASPLARGSPSHLEKSPLPLLTLAMHQTCSKIANYTFPLLLPCIGFDENMGQPREPTLQSGVHLFDNIVFSASLTAIQSIDLFVV
jgi:hypothetical protein